MSDPIATAHRNTRARAGLSELPFVTPEDIAERAMEAIHGAVMYRDHLRRFGPGNVRMSDVEYWAQRMARDGDRPRAQMMVGYVHVTTLPEAALDWPIYRAAIVAPISEVLYPAGNVDHEWDSETIEHVAHAVADVQRALPFTAPRPTTCGACDHTGTVDDHNVDGCGDCEELAQTGQYAPCTTTEA